MKCPVFKQCGGCSYPHHDYPSYLAKQKEYLHSLLSSFGTIKPIITMKEPFYYRNKVQSVVALGKKGEVVTGNYKGKTHQVVPIDHCLIEDQLAQEVIHSVRKLIPSFKWTVYDEDTQRGLIRHILVRSGHKTGEILLVIVVANRIVPGKTNFVKAIMKKHPQIKGVVFNLNGQKTSQVLGNRDVSVSGKGYIFDELLGKRFRLSASSFYQVNPIQTQKLYQTAIDLADLKPTDSVIDAYSGIGTIALSLADHVREVIAVESNKDAVNDAIYNAKLNNVTNVQFVADDATQFLQRTKRTPDCLIVDPPRAGCDRAFFDEVLRLSPKRFVYISCNPETLARDLKIVEAKYRIDVIQPVDMFPWTGHVETVVLLQRVNS